VTPGDIEEQVIAPGTLAPRDSADVVAQVSGRLTKLHVEVGSEVRQGDLLAEIDATAVADRLEVLRLQLLIAENDLRIQESVRDMAEREYKRLLAADGATAQSRLDADSAFRNAGRLVTSAKAQLEAHKANLRIEERNLGNARIVAPIGGTVMKVHAEVGQALNATQNAPVVMQIANLSTLTVTAAVNERDITRLHKGMAAYITVLGDSSRRWYGELRRIEPTPRVLNNVVSYNALFDLQNDRGTLRPQMTAQVHFITAEARNVLRVPTAALQQGQRGSAVRGMPPRNSTVTVMRGDGTLEVRPVVVGVGDRVYSEVLEGLKEGEEVVIGTPGAEGAASPLGN